MREIDQKLRNIKLGSASSNESGIETYVPDVVLTTNPSQKTFQSKTVSAMWTRTVLALFYRYIINISR